MRLLIRLLITAAAIVVAVALNIGITFQGITPGTLPEPRVLLNLLLVAAIFGLVNAIVRPLLKGLSCAITVATLGLFIFVVNALMLLLTSVIAQQFDLGLSVNGFVPALLGSIVISVVSLLLSIFVPDKDDRRRARR